MIRRPPRTTLDRSSAASDVYKRQTLYNPFSPSAATDGSGRTPFPNATIPASLHSRVSRQLIEWLPLPTRTDRVTQNYFASEPSVFDRDSTDAKVNWNVSNKFTMFGRFSILNFDIISPAPFEKASGGPIENGQQAGYGYG